MQNESQNNKPGLSEMTTELRRFVEKRLELFALTIGEHVSLILAEAIQQLIGILLVAGGLFIFWLGIGFYLGGLFDNDFIGFAVASLPLILFGLIFLKIKPNRITDTIQAGIMSEMIKTMDDRPERNPDNNLKSRGESESETG